MKIFFSVGEPSGDVHGANLIRRLCEVDPTVECVGYGGPRMAEAGLDVHADLTRMAVMFLRQVIFRVPQFYSLYRRADRYFAEASVDAVVLIDFSGFNWWIAKSAKRRGIPVFYYGVPQVWAWAPWRVRKLRRRVDHVICKLPFEEEWFRKRRCPAHFVGHPYFDELAGRELDASFMGDYEDEGTRLLTLLPGSRDQEVSTNLPWMLEAAADLHRDVDDLSVAIACYNDRQAERVRERVVLEGLPFDVMSGRTPELIHMADACLACSGSVSLELMYHQKPSVIVYRLSAVQWLLKCLLLRIPYVTLVNLLWVDDIDQSKSDLPLPHSPRLPFPEFTWVRSPVKDISRQLKRWLDRPTALDRSRAKLAELSSQFATGGATARAADVILRTLGVTHQGGGEAGSVAGRSTEEGVERMGASVRHCEQSVVESLGGVESLANADGASQKDLLSGDVADSSSPPDQRAA